MSAPIHTQDDYAAALLALLPRGAAWPRDPGSTQSNTAEGLANSFATVDASAAALLVDAFPSTAVDLLPEWEETLALPGTGSTSDRQAAVIAALTATGGQSRGYFIALASSLGFSISITEYRPTRVTDTVGRPIYGTDAAFTWLVTAPAGPDHTTLEAMFKQYAPAHTVVAFNYV